MRLLTTPTIDEPHEKGELIHACAISGANVIRDMREAIVNTIGGRMIRYEGLLDQTIGFALDNLAQRATDLGYDGVLDIRLSHPTITQGAIEVVATGTGFRLRKAP